jgi:hypothetical protein
MFCEPSLSHTHTHFQSLQTKNLRVLQQQPSSYENNGDAGDERDNKALLLSHKNEFILHM